MSILDISKVSWGSYSAWEGPVFWGFFPYGTVAKEDSFSRKLMAVLSSTEGGKYDAVNMYDRCILTVGIVQWCEAAPQCSVSDMLRLCSKRNSAKLEPYLDAIAPGLRIVEDNRGVGRLEVGRQRVDNTTMQKALYLGGASGLKGQWLPAQIQKAKQVCAAVASIWQEAEFREAQLDYTVPRLIEVYGRSFGTAPRRMFDPGFPERGFAGALRALYISYSANLPAIAARIFAATFPNGLTGDDENDCIALARSLALTSGVGIWPKRYEMIRPTLEALFEVNLPDHTSDLSAWRASFGPGIELTDVKAIQSALKKLGYDLGPSGPNHDGVDGDFGKKSRAALQTFERSKGIPADGVPDKFTLAALQEAIS